MACIKGAVNFTSLSSISSGSSGAVPKISCREVVVSITICLPFFRGTSWEVSCVRSFIWGRVLLSRSFTIKSLPGCGVIRNRNRSNLTGEMKIEEAIDLSLSSRYSSTIEPVVTFHPRLWATVRVRCHSFAKFWRFIWFVSASGPDISPIEGCGGVNPRRSNPSLSQSKTAWCPCGSRG